MCIRDRLKRAREQAQRTVCAAQLKQLTAAVVAYGIENRGRVPTGERNGGPAQGEHCIWVSSSTYDAVNRYLGAAKGKSTDDYVHAPSRSRIEQMFCCPNVWDSEGADIPYYAAPVG